MSRWTSWLPSSTFGFGAGQADPHELDTLRRRMLLALADCQSAPCDRLRMRLLFVRTAQDLWLARVELFHLISQQHCESLASERLDALVPEFERWLPARLMRGARAPSLT